MRELPNGDLVYPYRGKPPECPIGYTRDPGFQFVFHKDCKYRAETQIEKKQGCGACRPATVAYCTLHKTPRPSCKGCTDGLR